jgi:hypothetical protein
MRTTPQRRFSRASNASQDTTVTSSRYTSITHTSDDHGRAEVPGQTGSQVLDQYRAACAASSSELA